MSIRNYVGLGVAAGAVAVATIQSDAYFSFSSFMGHGLRMMEPERAHELGIQAAQWGLFPVERRQQDRRLMVSALGKHFLNPVGIAAGFDKDAKAIEPILNLGVGFLEVGSIPPQPQPGNPRPRCFRIVSCEAVVNRMGFNSAGAEAAVERLREYRRRRDAGEADQHKILAVNLGKNKEVVDAADDFCTGARMLAPFADFVVINVSSPNTPGLRALQGRRELRSLVTRVQQTMREMHKADPSSPQPPLLIKIAPDLTPQDRADVAAVALETGVQGLVVGNTTITRPGVPEGHPVAAEAGGLSGQPLFDLSTEVLRDMYVRTKGKVVLVGCGGVASGEQAYAKIRAGASLVELYTSMIYKGPVVIPQIKRELIECLDRDGLANIEDAIGADHR